MRPWRVVLLVDLALLLGLGAGYLWWGQQARRLAGELQAARAAAAVTAGGEREYHATGVVRAGIADLGILVITHGDIPGYMPAMTMGFRTASPKILESVRPGDEVRFTLRGTPPNLAITAIDKTVP
jgi:Cu/Ag efflux protein CusF